MHLFFSIALSCYNNLEDPWIIHRPCRNAFMFFTFYIILGAFYSRTTAIRYVIIPILILYFFPHREVLIKNIKICSTNLPTVSALNSLVTWFIISGKIKLLTLRKVLPKVMGKLLLHVHVLGTIIIYVKGYQIKTEIWYKAHIFSIHGHKMLEYNDNKTMRRKNSFTKALRSKDKNVSKTIFNSTLILIRNKGFLILMYMVVTFIKSFTSSSNVVHMASSELNRSPHVLLLLSQANSIASYLLYLFWNQIIPNHR